MAVNKKQLEYAKKYQSKFDDIKVRVPHGDRDRWRSEADSRGKSLNQFIIDSVENEIENGDQ